MSAEGKGSLWVVYADGSHAEEVVPPADILETNEGIPVSRDGRTVTYSLKTEGFYQFINFDIAARQSRQLTFTPDDKYSASRSPDGRWLVYSSNAGGTVNLWRIPASGGTPEQMTRGDDRVRHMFYSPDGRWIYFQPNHQNIYRMPATGGTAQRVTHFSEPTLFIEEPAISPDGRYLYYCRGHGGSSLWLLTIAMGNPGSAPEK